MESFEGAQFIGGTGSTSSCPAATAVADGGFGDVPVSGFPQSIIPFTLKTISALEPSIESEAMFYYHGMPVTTVRVLGKMHNRRDLDGETSFLIHDGTGSIDARVALYGVHYPPDLQKVKDGDYVEVNGGLVYYGAVKSIEVYSFRLVTNFNDITQHFLLCVYVFLDLKKRAKARRDAVQNAPADVHMPPEEIPPPLNSNGTGLFDNVLHVFLQPGLSNLENGATFALIQQKTGARAEDLRAVIDAHITLGNMFTTIDDDHFKSSMNG